MAFLDESCTTQHVELRTDRKEFFSVNATRTSTTPNAPHEIGLLDWSLRDSCVIDRQSLAHCFVLAQRFAD
jgi:hypothetical protein